MGISALLAAQILDASATGRSVLTGVDASAIRTTLGLGTLATQSPTGTPSASTFLRGDFSWQTIDLSGYLQLTGGTMTGRLQTPSILLAGNFSATAWTTNGVGLSHTARTLTDTSSTGTVATAYTNVLGGNTIAASNATTFTDYASLFLGSPSAGSNVTITNPFSLITQGAVRIGGQLSLIQGTANTSVLTSTGYSLTGSNAQSLIDVSGTWNTTGTPTLLKANVTDTASNANSLLMDLQVGGSSRFRVQKDGRLIGNSWGITNDAGFTRIDDGSSGTRIALLGDSQFQLQSQTWFIDKSASSIDFSTAGTRSFVFSPTSNIFQLRRTTNAQVLQVYNTFTDASNYERGQLAWQSNQFRIGVENAGTGSTRTFALGYWSAGNFVQLFYGDTTYGNVWIGQGAGQGSTNYQGNVAIGNNALGSTTTNNGSGIVAIGSAALRYLNVSNSSDASVAIGSEAGVTCRAATTTTLIGGAAGRGSSNFTARLAKTTSVGYESGYGFDATTLTGNSFFGYRAGYSVSSGNNNTCIGSEAGDAITTGSNNIAIGYNVDVDSATASDQINIGNVYYHDRIAGAKTFSGNVTITQGTANTSVLTSTGYSLTGSNAQSLIDLSGTWNTTGTPTLIKANVTDTASNANSLLMDLQVGGTSRFSVRKDGTITIADTANIATGTTTGTKIGTATTQKLGLWNATPIVQPTTAVGSATVASPGGGSTIKTDDTFDGYTVAQVVKALRNVGLLA